ncbi:hypothetical protein FPSE_06981 [Fusarium pseudograminearum CS3096]|uniref:Uncharacterized protein n=1 Tax=Fusarium pseudograminearum (strain CS3096) TaxID=1028729 RepID=K3VZT0_FUSPC|nr:hypothetical protein FPSE_06981 [Fusarium pseudograminearum CS3096]EKJ72935.1 hypothetical protein FPSE_06981 [Fusarium pseudograminearum CS3096]
MSSTNDDKTEDRPRWLINIENSIKEELEEFPSEPRCYEIVRDLLLAPKDNEQAVPDAVDRFYQLCADGAETEQREPPEFGAAFKLNSIAGVVFEVVRDVFYTTLEHDRLTELLIGIKKGAAAEYDAENPRFVYHDWGLETIANGSWNASHVDASTANLATDPEQVWTEAWINTSALISKLYKEGLLDTEGLIWLTWDFVMAFEKLTKGDVASDAGRQAQVLAPINHILLAGEPFADEAKVAADGRILELNAAKWKLWASKIKEIADAVDDGARWDLKSQAQKAFEKMVTLYPEAFE